jgi:hypothetical protein
MPTDDNRLTISALSDTLENKRKRRKQLLNLSATPQSNMSNSSSPEPQLLKPNSSTSIKYLNSSNLNKFNTLSQAEKSNFRDLKNVTPSTTADGQDSDDDIIIGNNKTKSNLSDSFSKNYKNVKS